MQTAFERDQAQRGRNALLGRSPRIRETRLFAAGHGATIVDPAPDVGLVHAEIISPDTAAYWRSHLGLNSPPMQPLAVTASLAYPPFGARSRKGTRIRRGAAVAPFRAGLWHHST